MIRNTISRIIARVSRWSATGNAGEEIDDEMRSFYKAIAISFSFLAALIVLMMFFQTRLLRVSSFSERSA
jgi:hypothetical protein